MRKSQSYSLTEGPLLPAIVRFSIPLMLSNVLQVLFNMSDIAVVRRWGRWAPPPFWLRCSLAS